MKPRAIVIRSVLLAAAMLVAISACVASAAPAAVGTYDLQPCNFENLTEHGYGEWSALSGNDNGKWGLTARCPSDVEFSLVNATGVGSGWRHFDFPAANSSANTIKAVSFDLKGSNGSDGNLEQAIVVCTPTEECSPPIMPAGADGLDLEPHSLTAADLPPGTNHIEVRGRCKPAMTCTRARPLHLLNLDITFNDSTKPTIVMTDNPVDTTAQLIALTQPGQPKNWMTSRVTTYRRFDVTASDDQSGVLLVYFQFSHVPLVLGKLTMGGHWSDQEPYCGISGQQVVGYLCPQSLDKELRFQPFASLNNFGIVNGLNHIAATATDLAGNVSSEAGGDFYIDSISPTMNLLQPLGEDTFWQSGTSFHVSWQNTGEVLETETASGLAGARWTVANAATGGLVGGYNGEQSGVLTSLDAIPLPGKGVWTVFVSTFDRAGNSSSNTTASSPNIGATPHPVTVGVDPTVLEAPQVATIPTIGAPELLPGATISWQKPSNSAAAISGICSYAMKVDQNQASDPGLSGGIDGGATSAKLTGPLADGTNYLHLRAISCAGVGGKIADVPFTVDAAAPQLGISKPSPGGWYSDQYPLTASVVSGDESGLTMSIALDNGAPAFLPVSQLDAPLTEGTHLLTVAAKDALGNQSTFVAQVQIDGSPPTLQLAPFDPGHPTKVSATATDGGSGVTEARLQYRAAGTTSWHSFGEIARPQTGSAPTLDFSADLRDADMPNGVYELQAVARDDAGHLAATPSGQASVTLPLRKTPLITTAFSATVRVKVCTHRGVSGKCTKHSATKHSETRDFALVAMGRQALMSGKLVGANGLPIAGAAVQIFESSIDKPRAFVTSVPTDAKGEFAYTVAAGTSRRVTARFDGDDTNAAAESTAKFLVTPAVSLKIRSVRSAKSTQVTFSGRVLAPGATMPKSGLPVKIQYQLGGSDKLFSTAGVADAGGYFTIERSFAAQKHPLRFTVRAIVPWFDGWPYEAGSSQAESFVVR